MKKTPIFFFAVFLLLGLFQPIIINAKEPPRAKCKMTIEEDKHTKDKPALANKECKDLIFGYYSKNVKGFKIFGMANKDVTQNGQKFIISVFSDKFAEAELTVYINNHQSEVNQELDTISSKLNKNRTSFLVYLSIGVFAVITIIGGIVRYRKRR
ncbi:hypothetical protein MXL46_13875 [Heyndrickxia sporothermodurans]|uniref:hypothetical protein n=1 Tax=Heyndrickxia sporothermodurans TaxID=46224 RepID=UPI002DBF304F|nr:hypothetical protein [Heyndrickxia sporothermodurans]MEB6550179.1 hypothetical protein [Heyndrickxia sporothermodurans]